jgi:hypothetical protein
VLGAADDNAIQDVQKFIVGLAGIYGVKSTDLVGAINRIEPEDRKYYPQVVNYERAFMKVCDRSKIGTELRPLVAGATAGKLVLAGNQLKLLDGESGLAIACYHVLAGAKTIPFPPT